MSLTSKILTISMKILTIRIFVLNVVTFSNLSTTFLYVSFHTRACILLEFFLPSPTAPTTLDSVLWVQWVRVFFLFSYPAFFT